MERRARAGAEAEVEAEVEEEARDSTTMEPKAEASEATIGKLSAE